jgi:hypothetical protein
MALESTVQASAGLVPRHYVLNVQAAIAPSDMVQLAQALESLDVADDACGGFFGALREAVAEAFNGDVPQPIVVPDVVPVDDEPDDGGGALAK